MAAQAKRSGLKYIIEEKLESYVFFAVLPFMVATAAQVFSGGVFSIVGLLGPFFPVWQIIRGVALGFGSETLAVISGRGWLAWRREAAEILTRPGLNKFQRNTLANEARSHARRSFWFMWVGVGSSVFAGLSYYAGAVHTMSTGELINDLVATLVITAVVMFLGVFRDSKSNDEGDELLSGVEAGMNGALFAAIERFKAGTATDADIAFIAEHLPPHKAQKFRRAVAKKSVGEMWTSGMIREALGYGNDPTVIRKLNGQIRKLAEDPENKLTRGPDGKSWLIPRAIVMDIWGEQIAEARAQSRTLNGRSIANNSSVPASRPDVIRTFPGRVPDVGETVAG